MPVRLKDIAKDLGLSTVTVSKVLRNHSDISEPTRRRVLQRMRELDYRPNLAARALITGRSMAIGLLVPDLLHPFFAEVAKAVSATLRSRGYSLVISSFEDNPVLEREEIDRLLARRVDALMIASAQVNVESLRHIEEQGTAFVLIDRCFEGFAANFVGVDDEQAGFLATGHLLQQGYRWVAHIRVPDISTGVRRQDGYRRALAAHGREYRAGHVISIGSSGDDHGEIGAFEAAQTLLRTDPRPDAIFCYNDPVALGAMRAILHAGLRIPDDIAVVGCGNLPYSDFLRIPLTTIDQGTRRIGAQAGELALSLIEAKSPPTPKCIVIQPELVVRASSRKVGRAIA